jgi:hypothetical protein
MYLSTLLQLFCGAQFYWWRKQLAPYTTITNCHVKLYRVHPITGRNRITITNCHVKLYRVHPITGRNRITITNCHVKLYRVHPITGRNRIHNFSGDGKSGDTVNIGHKTKNEDKLNIKTTWKTKKTRNTDPTKNPEMDLFGYY